MADSHISVRSLQKALETASQISPNKRRRSEGENSNMNIPKAITGGVLKSKTSSATMPNEAAEINELIITYKKLDENTENQAKGIQKLHETLEDGFSKILRISEAKVTNIQTKKDDSSHCKVKELQELRGKTENQAIELQKLHEKLEEVLDQTMRKHEDLMRMSEAKKIPTKKLWSGKADLCTVKDLEVLTDNFSERNLIGDTTYGKLYRGKLKLDSTGAKTKDVVVKIWDEKADRLDDGKVVKEEVKFLADSLSLHRNLPKLISFCNYGDSDPLMKNGVVYDVHALGRLCDYIPKDNFSWIQRFKVAYELALLLEHLHIPDRPYVIYNLDTENIVLNQEYSPVVVDFGLLFGGYKGGPRYIQEFEEMSLGYDDPYLAYAGKRTPENDVHSYGINLLALMAMRTDKNIDSCDYKSRATLTLWIQEKLSVYIQHQRTNL